MPNIYSSIVFLIAFLSIKFPICDYILQLSGSNFFGWSTGSSKRTPVSNMMHGSEAETSRRYGGAEAIIGGLRKVSNTQKSSHVASTKQKPPSTGTGRQNNSKDFDSTLKGIEAIHLENDERHRY